MDNQTFIFIGGLMIAAFGAAYIISEKFALLYYHSRGALGVRNFLCLSESTGVTVIRFVLGPILLMIGFSLVFFS